MRAPKVITHPVMGWFIIILLATIVAIPPVYLLASPHAARMVSYAGQAVAIFFAMGAMSVDLWRRARQTTRRAPK
jgi:hypothetical protein